jgi:hypothetical protein
VELHGREKEQGVELHCREKGGENGVALRRERNGSRDFVKKLAIPGFKFSLQRKRRSAAETV